MNTNRIKGRDGKRCEEGQKGKVNTRGPPINVRCKGWWNVNRGKTRREEGGGELKTKKHKRGKVGGGRGVWGQN